MSKHLFSTLAVAVSGLGLAFEPAAIITDSGFELTPTLEFETKYNTQGGDRATQILLAPAVSIAHSDGAIGFLSNLGAGLGMDVRGSDEQLLFADLNADAAFRFAHTEALSSELGAGIKYVHTDDSVDGTDGDYGYKLVSGAFAGLRLGNPESQMQLAGTLGVENTRYTNYEELAKEKDGTAISFNGELAYLLASATHFETELSAKSSTFANNEAAYNLEFGLMTGLAWQQVANTNGRLLLGYKGVEFTNNSADNYGGFAVTAMLSSEIGSFLLWENTADSKLTQSNGNRLTELESSVKWTAIEALTFTGMLGYTENCKADNSTKLGLGVLYSPQRFLQLGLDYELTLPEESNRGHQLALNIKAGL